MNIANHSVLDNNNSAGFPPAPSKAHQSACWPSDYLSESELIEMQHPTHHFYNASATHSILLAASNDGPFMSEIDAMRNPVTAQISTADVQRLLYESGFQVDDWARGTANYQIIAETFNEGHEPEPVSDTVMSVLLASTVSEDLVQLPKQLERPLYNKINDILTALGGKWNKKRNGHVFTVDPTDRIQTYIDTGTTERPEKFGFFPTPEHVARRLISIAGIVPTDPENFQILEPSAGTGNLARLCAELVPQHNVHCIELQPHLAKHLQSLGFDVVQRDFMKTKIDPTFDAVVMNPPFERQQDIDHVMHAYQFLVPGGVLAAVMSAGILFRDNAKTVKFRSFLQSHDAVIEENSPGAFKESGTMARTIFVTFKKPLQVDHSQFIPQAKPNTFFQPSLF